MGRTVVVAVMTEEDVMEVYMVKTDMNFPAGTEICDRSSCIPCIPMENPLLATKE